MDLFALPSAERPFALRALRTVAAANGEIGAPEIAMLRAAADAWRIPFAPSDVASIEPAELARVIEGDDRRQHVLQACMLMSLADQHVTDAELAVLEAFRAALGVDEARMPMMRDLAKGRLFQARMHFRSASRAAIRSQLNDAGIGDVLRTAGVLPPNRELETKVRALEGLPDGTLGREYFHYLRRNGFSLPGTKGGTPEGLIHHDLTHVLTAYDTDPIGEIEIGSYTAGMKKVDPFTFLLFVMLEFHVGLAVRPFSESDPGHYDAHRAFQAHQAGARCARDLTDHWDFWPDLPRTVAELRRELAIVPVA